MRDLRSPLDGLRSPFGASRGPTGPTNTVAPVVSGTATVGQTLSTTNGTWSGVGTITYAYQWLDDGATIPGATSSTYTLTAAEEGGLISCRVTATDDNGSTPKTSNSVGPVAAAAGLPATTLSALSVARAIDSSYAGNLIRVRRSSDNAEADIGQDGSGNLDETALLAHVGTGGTDNGFVVTIYEQSGHANAVNYTQATSARQPAIVQAGVVVKKNSKVALVHLDPADGLVSATWSTRPSSATVMDVASFSDYNADGNVWVWANGGAAAAGLLGQSGSSLTSIQAAFGTPTYYKDDALFSPANRGAVFTGVMTDTLMLIRAEGCSFADVDWAALSTQQHGNNNIQGAEYWSERVIISGTDSGDISSVTSDQATFYGITI